MHALPRDASPASHRLADIATKLAAACPPHLGAEIGITGSVSHGYADEYSDIELNFWLDSMPPFETRWAWLESAGATALRKHEEHSGDGMEIIICDYEGATIEAGWQESGRVDAILAEVLTARTTAHGDHIIAEVVAHTVPLRTAGALARWQTALAVYPDAVREALLVPAIRPWTVPIWVDARWAAAARGQRLSLNRMLVGDMERLLRIVFALNSEWEPVWKWVRHATRSFKTLPENFADRMDAALSEPDALSAVRATYALVLDTLALLPPRNDATTATTLIRSLLR